MLGPNPKKAATPATEQPPQTTAGGDGLMVKAIADIYKHIEEAENPEAYKVWLKFIFPFNSHSLSYAATNTLQIFILTEKNDKANYCHIVRDKLMKIENPRLVTNRYNFSSKTFTFQIVNLSERVKSV